MIGESCDPASQGRPLSFLALCWGLGTVIGEPPQTCRVPCCAEVRKLPIHFCVGHAATRLRLFTASCRTKSRRSSFSALQHLWQWAAVVWRRTTAKSEVGPIAHLAPVGVQFLMMITWMMIGKQALLSSLPHGGPYLLCGARVVCLCDEGIAAQPCGHRVHPPGIH